MRKSHKTFMDDVMVSTTRTTNCYHEPGFLVKILVNIGELFCALIPIQACTLNYNLLYEKSCF